MMSNLELIVSVVSFIGFGGLMTCLGFVWKLADRLATLEHEVSAAAAAAQRSADEAKHLAQRLSDFQVEASARFVSNEAWNQVLKAIDRLGDRIDRFIEGGK